MAHRDVKPGNVLLTPAGEPKVADFGLARRLDDPEQSRTGESWRTPSYCSPEQAAGKRGDHRTDVFSLGAVLYELLTLRKPFEGDTTALIEEKVRLEDPPEPRTIRSRVPGDLAVICGKCLEKSPDRRFATMAELAAELRRHLANQPIETKPPGPLRKLQLWARRNPTKGVAGTIAVAAFATISVLLIDNVRGRQHLELANRETGEERDRLKKLVEFQEGLFDNLDPESFGARLRVGVRANMQTVLGDRGHTEEEIAERVAALDQALAPVNFTDIGVSALEKEILDPARMEALRQFVGDPVMGATMQESIAAALEELGRYGPALELRTTALEAWRTNLGEDHPRTLASLGGIGSLLLAMKEFDGAKRYLEAALKKRREVLGEDHLDTLRSMNNLGWLFALRGERDESRPYLENALRKRRELLGDDDPETIGSLNNMGSLLESTGELEAARPYLEEALSTRRRSLGNEHPETLQSMANIGVLLRTMGKLEEAKPFLEEALATSRKVQGNDHPDVLGHVNNLGLLLQSMGQLAAAKTYYQEALGKRRELLGDNHPDTVLSVNNLGSLFLAMRRPKQARPLLEEALRQCPVVLGESHSTTLGSIYNMGVLMTSVGKLDEARKYFEDSLHRRRRVLGDDHPETLSSWDAMGQVLGQLWKPEEALTYFEQGLQNCRKALGNEHPRTVNSVYNLGAQLVRLKRYEEAVPHFEEALSSFRVNPGRTSPRTLQTASNLGWLWIVTGEHLKARRILEGSLEEAKGALPSTDAVVRSLMETLASCYEAIHQASSDESLAKKAAALRNELR